MNLKTLELHRFKCPKGYGDSVYPNESSILNTIVDFTRNTEYKIYKHVVRRVEEEKDYEDYYVPNLMSNLEIPYCDIVYYLDIYYQ